MTVETKNYFLEGDRKLRENFKKYFPYYLLFIFISWSDLVSDYVIPREGENFRLIFALFIFGMTLFSAVLFLRTQKKEVESGDFWYMFVPFMLYSIYYSIVSILGIVLLFIPGVLFFYAPLIAVFHDKAPPFKTSMKLAKLNLKLTGSLAFGSLFLELIPLGLNSLPKTAWSILAGFSFSFIEAYLYMLFMIISVRYYYEKMEILDENI